MSGLLKKVLVWSLITLIIVVATACGQNQEKKVVIASKPFSESYILAEMLTLIIEAETDIVVEKKFGIAGGTSNIQPAMEKGEIDMYPEYTGTSWLFVLKQDLVNDPQELYQKTKEMYMNEYNFVWSGLYGFNNTYALAVKKSVSEDMGIKSYTDLANNSPKLVFGAEYDFYERDDGFNALTDLYGFDFKSTEELDIGLKYAAIGGGDVDVINAFSTDGLLQEYNMVVLEDDMNFFPAYHGGTVIRKEVLEMYPELDAVIELLTDLITDEEMIMMNFEVDKENKDPRDVAETFLIRKGLL